MRLIPRSWSLSTLLTSCLLATLPGLSMAERVIMSNSLNPCQPVNNFTASLFNVYFTPDNATLSFNVVGVASISGNVTALVEVIAYGYTAVKQTIDPCAQGITQLCPLNPGQIKIQSNVDNISPDVIKIVPGITYGIPDLDGVIRVYVFNDAGVSIACVEADLSNGKSVYQKGVGWSVAIVAGLALVASAVTSGLGHSNTAAHVAANALSLFGFFQAQALIGMSAVPLPPIVRAWTQNFQWSMGIIDIQFMQDIFTWYQKATGGTPSTVLDSLSTTSVQVQKRSLEYLETGVTVANTLLGKRDTDANGNQVNTVKVVRGISRVAFNAQIEVTNLFLTGITFFLLFVILVVIGVGVFKLYTELAAKRGWIRPDRFQDFRNGWLWVLKGIMYRIALIAFPQIVVLCLWEMTQRDSVAEVVLAICFFIAIVGILVWASFKVVAIAKRSVVMHQSPAYILYSDPATLNKWGFLYVQFRATAYYFIIPVLIWVGLKGAFIAFGQGNGLLQAIALVIIELAFLVLVSYYRPWMDKKINWFNISIAAVNLVNAIMLLIFTGAFNQPAIVTGIFGVIFFFLNAVFALTLLILVLIASAYAVFSKNPDTRYQPARDDRGSFIKSHSNLNNNELDALGATARGDGKFGGRDLDGGDDSPSMSTTTLERPAPFASEKQALANSYTPQSSRPGTAPNTMPSSPVHPSYADRGRMDDSPRPPPNASSSLLGNMTPQRNNNASPSRPATAGSTRIAPPGPLLGPNRAINNRSPWQAGVGYDH